MTFLENLFENQVQFFNTPLGVLMYVIFYALWVTVLLPGSWMSMLGGFLYGSLFGSIYVFFAAILGASLTFYSGRKLFGNWIQKRLVVFPKYQLIEQSITKEGIRFIILTRLSPAFPFGLLNLAYGLSKVSFKDFILGLFAILPGTVLYCSLGSLASEISRINEVLQNQDTLNSFAITLVGFIATFLVVFMVVQNVQKSLRDPN